MAKQYDILVRLLMIGDSGVGKTCMLCRFTDEGFITPHLTTIGWYSWKFIYLARENCEFWKWWRLQVKFNWKRYNFTLIFINNIIAKVKLPDSWNQMPVKIAVIFNLQNTAGSFRVKSTTGGPGHLSDLAQLRYINMYNEHMQNEKFQLKGVLKFQPVKV